MILRRCVWNAKSRLDRCIAISTNGAKAVVYNTRVNSVPADTCIAESATSPLTIAARAGGSTLDQHGNRRQQTADQRQRQVRERVAAVDHLLSRHDEHRHQTVAEREQPRLLAGCQIL